MLETQWYRSRGLRIAGIWILLFVLTGFVMIYGDKIINPSQFWKVNYLIVFGIGLMVGMTEMMARYRDAPFRPIMSLPGVLYFAINGLASILAYYLIDKLSFQPDIETTTAATNNVSSEIYKVLAASLGAMAFFRSGFFTMRLGENDVAIGPNLILQVLLHSLDRAYDRDRAAPRSELAREIMGGVSFESARIALPVICFNLMQNVTDDERESVGAEVAALDDDSSMNDEARVLNLGLTLMNVVGEKALKAAVSALGPTVQGVGEIDNDMLLQLASIPANTVIESLPMVCNELCHETVQLENPEKLSAQVNALGLGDDNKAIIMLYKVIRHYGPATVNIALGAMAA